MAAIPKMRVLVNLSQSLLLQQSLRLVPLQLTSTSLLGRFCSTSNEPKQSSNPVNTSLLDNLNLLGVDLKRARQRQPGVFRKAFTNEKGVAQFLQEKGASSKVIASIVSRYPRVITRSITHLEQRWQLWRNIFNTDEEIVSILNRSPESFFRTSDNENLEKNIAYLISLGLSSKDLHRLLTTAPRTFSNSVELNKQMVELLEEICLELGGNNPVQFAKNILSKNVYMLIRSTKRVRTNIDYLKASLRLNDSDLLTFLQGHGAGILDLSNEYMKNNFNNIEENLSSLGCKKDDIIQLIINHPVILYIGSQTLNSKIECLLKGGITIKQILEKPRVLDYSEHNYTERLNKLREVGYDFKKYGISILASSRKRFYAKMEKLSAGD
ncbi:transcription termination factor 1, mitochondrial [Nothobranchius furzeri]|nr:mitochondrial transcription termination factor 1 [Nothobranchius furzeri]